MRKDTKIGQFKVIFKHLYGQWRERPHRDNQSYSKSLLRMNHTHNFLVIITDRNAPVTPNAQPPCNDLYIGYSSIGIVPAVSKYYNKIKNKNVMHNKRFRN